MKNAGAFATVYCCHNACTIIADTVDGLIACVEGIQDGSIAGAPADMPLPTDEKPLIGREGSCSILF